jgi:hypothetical protein
VSDAQSAAGVERRLYERMVSPIYVIATKKVEQEIEAGASGIVQWTGRVGVSYDIAAEIGVITW